MDKIIPKLGEALIFVILKTKGTFFAPYGTTLFFLLRFLYGAQKKSGLCFILLKARLLVSTQLAKRIRPRD